MSPGKMRASVVHDKLALIEQLRRWIDALPIGTWETFTADPMPAAAAESYVRRVLEVLFDLGRHVLAKGFGDDASEYKAVAARLGEHGVLSTELAQKLVRMAGYRNRLVHFYHDVTPDELYTLCTEHIGDVDAVAAAIEAWVAAHPDLVDATI